MIFNSNMPDMDQSNVNNDLAMLNVEELSTYRPWMDNESELCQND